MGLFSRNVSYDSSVETTVKVIELLCDTEKPDCPMLQIKFFKDYIDVLFVEGGHGNMVSLMEFKQRQTKLGSMNEESVVLIDQMIGKAFHASELPKGFTVEFKNNDSGFCDSCVIRGRIVTEHKNAEIDYMKEVAFRCTQKGIKYKMGQKAINFLNWS